MSGDLVAALLGLVSLAVFIASEVLRDRRRRTEQRRLTEEYAEEEEQP